ncbi:MAG: hypothetical protein ABSC57_04980 [Syntrophales bacterium]
MRKSILILALTLVLLLTLGINVQAQSKEVTESGVTTYYVTSKVLPLGERHFRMDYEAVGVTVNDTGEGLFHNATVHVLGGMTIEKGLYKDDRGLGVFNLQNGDKVFYKYEFAGEVIPKGVGIGKGTVTLVGGTGKCTGIQGSFESTRYTPRTPSTEGVGLSYTKGKFTYTLP